METMEERANAFAQLNNPTDYGDGKVQELMANKYFAYYQGATEQRAIDIDKACEWLKAYVITFTETPSMLEDFKKAMED